MGRAGRAAASLLLLLATGAGLLLLFEAAFRGHQAWRAWRGAEPWVVYDEELGYRLNPAHPGTNAHGLRDHPVPPKSDRFRILMLGDSVVHAGDHVDDTLTAHLRDALHDALPEDPVEVVNAGVPGYTTWQELLYLRRDGVRLQPDLVGVGFVANDLYRFLHQFRVEDGRIVGDRYELTEEALGTAARGERPLLSRSLFLAWLRRRAASLDWAALRDDDGGFVYERRPDFRSAWQEGPWEEAASWFEAIVETGRSHDFRVFVVAFPFGPQYRAEDLARDPERVLRPQRRLARICARLSVPLLDLHPHLDPERDLLPDGIHLTAAGRRRVGRITARFLIDRGLVAPALQQRPGGAEATTGAYVPRHAQGAMR